MDVIFFLKDRTAFIHQLYCVTSTPYIERIQKIENEEDPFVPFYSGGECDGEPAFLTEYIEATKSLDTLRLMYISMLMSALHLYLKTWTKQSHIPIIDKLHKSTFKNKGWFWGYSSHFSHHFNIDFKKAPVDLKILEEIILARNNIEHQSSIAGRPKYRVKVYKNLKSLSYIDEFSNHLLREIGFGTFSAPCVKVTEEQLIEAISTIEKFAEWFDSELEPQIYPSRAKMKE